MLIAPERHAVSNVDERRPQRLAGFAPPADPKRAAQMLTALIDAGLNVLPQPAAGATLRRWRALSEVAGCDLSLAKLVESHADVLAILKELNAPDGAPSGSAWAVWAAEPFDARVIVCAADGNRATLKGKKAWCLGAAHLSHVLMTAREADGSGLFPARAGGGDLRHAALGKVDWRHSQWLRCSGLRLRGSMRIQMDDASVWALRVRMSAEQCAVQMLQQVGRLLGAAPFCKDAGFVRMAADLQVFIRQSGGERAAASDDRRWAL